MIPNFKCPKCDDKMPGAYITGERTETGAYMYFACKNTKCLEIWRVHLDKEEDSE